MSKQLRWGEKYEMGADQAVPMERWGKDHWSTLAYLETLAVDRDGIIANEKMRCNPRLHRQLSHVSPFGRTINGDFPTQLKDGELPKHDDWSCLEDMVSLGLVEAYFRKDPKRRGELFGNVQVRVVLTEKGKALAEQLRRHKMDGGNFAQFEPVVEVV